MQPTSNIFSDSRIYGDDFVGTQLDLWYADEKEAYTRLANVGGSYSYGYHALNWLALFAKLPSAAFFPRAMAFGSSTGDELVPVSSRVGEVTLVDSSDSVLAADAARVVRATKEGIIKSRSEIFSLVTCLGVLHHVPNVTYVFSELVRVLEPGGYLLLREPIVSMGDWRLPRPGLTSRERGIPLGQLEKLIGVHGLTVCSRTLCGFPLTPALTGLLNSNAEVNGIYLSRWRTGVDFFLSRLFKWNVNYHPKKRLDYLRPRNVAYVLRKDVVLEGVRR